jgi:bifunctional oligoribonuclease and PAP phosphatase NrnA
MAAKKKKNASFNEIITLLQCSKSVLVTGHVRPDGDSLGCMIALARMLNSSGVKAVAACGKKGLGGPQFLTGVKNLMPLKTAIRKRYDTVVTVDCGSVDRVPEELHNIILKKTVINIDHHQTNTRFGSYNRVDNTASSTAEMLWEMARKAHWTIDHVVAEALWVALITDTGRFAHETTSPKTLRCAADLLKRGVRTSYINDQIYCSFSRTNMELKKRAFRSLTISEDNIVASVTLTSRDFHETGGTKADAEDIIEIPRSLLGNKVAIFYYESEDKSETRVSIRARDPLDATQLISSFDGGGHPRAAGCTIKEPLGTAKRILNNAIQLWINNTMRDGK